MKGQIILTHDTRVSLSELRPFGFMIITPFVTMHLQASSDAERDGWIASIQGAIRKANSERKTKTWQKIKRKAQEVKLAKKTGRGTHTFQASGQQFECDTRYEYSKYSF